MQILFYRIKNEVFKKIEIINYDSNFESISNIFTKHENNYGNGNVGYFMWDEQFPIINDGDELIQYTKDIRECLNLDEMRRYIGLQKNFHLDRISNGLMNINNSNMQPIILLMLVESAKLYLDPNTPSEIKDELEKSLTLDALNFGITAEERAIKIIEIYNLTLTIVPLINYFRMKIDKLLLDYDGENSMELLSLASVIFNEISEKTTEVATKMKNMGLNVNIQ